MSTFEYIESPSRSTPYMTQEYWTRLRAQSMRHIFNEIQSNGVPKSLEKQWGVQWFMHPKFSCFSNQPGQLLMGRVWLDNGVSAILAYGCDGADLEQSREQQDSWIPYVGLAARQGDEGRGAYLACFKSGAQEPELAAVIRSFDGDGSTELLGNRSALVESRDLSTISKALRLLASLPSQWDGPEQKALWNALRESHPMKLKALLKRHPQWTRKRWGVGSSLAELAVRRGDWASCKELSVLGPQYTQEESCLLSSTLVSYAIDSYEHQALMAAPKILISAWSSGLRLDYKTWVDSFAQSQCGGMAAQRWAQAEALWLGSSGGATTSEVPSSVKRL